MTYTMTVIPAESSDYVQPSFIVPKALVFEYESDLTFDCVEDVKPIIIEVLQRFPDAKGDLYEVVLHYKKKPIFLNFPTKMFVPTDLRVIEVLQKLLQNENGNMQPKTWALKTHYECIEKEKKQQKARSRVQPKSSSMPEIDLSDVPQSLMFMTTAGFKDQAEDFYEELSYVQPSSDRAWVKRRFVDGLSTWPHIKNADVALNGIISQALSIVAENPHFPPWWRSIAVSLAKGNPSGVIRTCLDVIDFTGDISTPFGDGITDKNYRTHSTSTITHASAEETKAELEWFSKMKKRARNREKVREKNDD